MKFVREFVRCTGHRCCGQESSGFKNQDSGNISSDMN